MHIQNFLPKNKETILWSQIADEAHPYFLSQIKALTPGNILYIAKDDNRIKMIKNNLHFYQQDLSIITLPSWDLIPYDRTSPAKELS
jgi:transcription-repair coupling factor (superfamily II helicase)